MTSEYTSAFQDVRGLSGFSEFARPANTRLVSAIENEALAVVSLPALDAEAMTMLGHVGRNVEMPVGAVGLGSLSCCHSRASQAAPDVLLMRDGFKVARADTSTYSAQVVEVAPIGDKADEQFICETVGSDKTLNAHWTERPHVETAVADVVSCASPDPARGGLFYLRPEALFEWWINSLRHLDFGRATATAFSAFGVGVVTLYLHRILQRFGVTRPDVSASRPHPILPEGAL